MNGECPTSCLMTSSILGCPLALAVNEVLGGSYGAGFVAHAQDISSGDDTPGDISSHAPAVFVVTCEQYHSGMSVCLNASEEVWGLEKRGHPKYEWCK